MTINYQNYDQEIKQGSSPLFNFQSIIKGILKLKIILLTILLYDHKFQLNHQFFTKLLKYDESTY